MPDFSIEDKYKDSVIAGVDEAGRGPLAGPVVAAAVIVDQKKNIPGIKDSKKLSKQRRKILFDEITKYYSYGIGIVNAEMIDKINILNATKKACELAILDLKISPDIVLIDGNMKFNNENFVSIIKGDDKSISIAAASIVAKVTRDRIMTELAKKYPHYQWQQNGGYGTKHHLEAIYQHGKTKYHRNSFNIKNCT